MKKIGSGTSSTDMGLLPPWDRHVGRFRRGYDHGTASTISNLQSLPDRERRTASICFVALASSRPPPPTAPTLCCRRPAWTKMAGLARGRRAIGSRLGSGGYAPPSLPPAVADMSMQQASSLCASDRRPPSGSSRALRGRFALHPAGRFPACRTYTYSTLSS